MSQGQKFCNESSVTMTEMVMPNDTNYLNNLMGGRLMHWMDVVGAIAAQRHCNGLVVTASVDNISFRNPIGLGHVVTLKAFVTRSFNTSMEVYMEVTAEKVPELEKIETNSAFFTFVAVSPEGSPIPVAEAIPQTERERKLHAGALRRRQLRLILGNRMKPQDATELMALFKDK
ncbi:acyl-CoA thioesterase [Marinoscillum sp. MHG1-6]|uniref:acyl-CoA thioesterase n=1 Tax=Marinoscillum sp. MHG1-6 TaxID=2959627 RepID=UPI0021580904|nr:acyl-CoA thioesterase [Marinoscillum sp. MHG1-6]